MKYSPTLAQWLRISLKAQRTYQNYEKNLQRSNRRRWFYWMRQTLKLHARRAGANERLTETDKETIRAAARKALLKKEK